MLDDPQIQKLMKQIAAGVFPASELLEVHSEPALDAAGQDALRITLVLTDEAAKALTGKQIASLLTDLHDRLQTVGDDRFPLLHYATPSDLGDDLTDED